MFNRIQLLSFAAAGALIVLAPIGKSARANELAQNLGPVGPHEPIITTVGSERVIAFYVPGGGYCAVNAVVWGGTDVAANSAATVRVSLEPGQIVHIDSAENDSLNLQCGRNAASLAVVEDDEFVVFGITIQGSGQSIRANASGF